MPDFELEMHGLSDTGLKRDNNEDCIASNTAKGFAILADGMGGYKAGEIASAIAVATLIEYLEKNVDTQFSGTDEQTVLSNAILAANKAIFDAAEENEQYKNMGTTLVVFLLNNNQIHYGHVGDSRLYRLRGNELEQITADHSLVNELVQKGFYTEEEAKKADNKNIITRAMGVKPEVEPDITSTPALANDIYMMCSDGLSDLVDNNTIKATMCATRDTPINTCEELIKLANNNGGKDNVSVIVTKVNVAKESKPSKAVSIINWLFKH